MSNSSSWPIDSIQSDVTTPDQSRPGSDGNEEVLHIPQNSSITGASPPGCLVSYQGHLSGVEFYPSAEMQLIYSTASVDRVQRNDR